MQDENSTRAEVDRFIFDEIDSVSQLEALLVFADLVLLPDVDLYVWRLVTAAAAMLILVYGLVWEGDK